MRRWRFGGQLAERAERPGGTIKGGVTHLPVRAVGVPKLPAGAAVRGSPCPDLGTYAGDTSGHFSAKVFHADRLALTFDLLKIVYVDTGYPQPRWHSVLVDEILICPLQTAYHVVR